MSLTTGANWQDHLNRIAGFNRETVQPSRRLATEHSSRRRQLHRLAEHAKSLRVAGGRNVGKVNDIHCVTMRPAEHGDNPAC